MTRQTTKTKQTLGSKSKQAFPSKGKKAQGTVAKETLKLTIDALDNEGIAQARHEGKTALVQGALPGETVLVEVEHTGRTHIFTRLLKVLRNSPQRTANIPCKNELECLGCPLIGMKYQAQLDFKQQRVVSALAAQGLLHEDLVLPTLGAEPALNYRASAKLVFSRKREKVSIGLYKRGSHDVIDCPDCPVHHPLINRIVAVVRDEVQRLGISVYSAKHKNGLLRYLMIRVSPSNDKAMVTFVSNFRDLQQLPKLAKSLTRKIPEVIAVHQNVNSSTGNVIFGQESLKLLGTPDLIDRVGDIRLHISPGAFFQVNTLQAAHIYALVREWAQLQKHHLALDLYCGIGGITLHLAKDAGKVFGIEVVPEAVSNASESARLNSLHNCRFSVGDAAEELRKLTSLLPSLEVAVVNPPRKGCDPEVLETLTDLTPRRLIYVSCDPDSLARDLALLTQKEYRIEKIQPVDMFPQTSHVETVVLLTRSEDS